MQEIARDVAVIPTLIANAYLVGNAHSWVLVDTCTPGHERLIRSAAEARFGPDARPRAIVLTHGHFDHAGSAGPLADLWGAPIYAHPREIPFLTGKANYPQLDRTGPGFFSVLSHVFPTRTVNLGDRLVRLDAEHPALGFDEWECLYTPGHTPGHLAFFRRSDRVLLAGDALTTMDLDSLLGTLLKRRKICRPPIPATTNWDAARRSVELMASLEPRTVAAAHGAPMHEAAAELRRFAEHFPVPAHGRYVREPIRVTPLP